MLCWNTPINAKRVIKDADATISLWMVKLIALVLEHGCIGENGKAVSKAFGDEELLSQLTVER